MKILNYLMDHILNQVIQDYFNCIIKKPEIMADNLLITIYVNQIENRITFRMET